MATAIIAQKFYFVKGEVLPIGEQECRPCQLPQAPLDDLPDSVRAIAVRTD